MGKHSIVYPFAFAGLLTLAMMFLSGGSHPQQENAGATKGTWEYKVMDLEADQCSADQLALSLNQAGQLGWELVAYIQFSGGDTVLVRPAATGYGKTSLPQLADSFQGTITPGASPKCRLVLK